MAKVTGEMILEAIRANAESQNKAFETFEQKMELKLHGVEDSVHVRLDAQRDKMLTVEKKVDDLAEHVGVLKIACFFAKWFKPPKVPDLPS